MKKLTTNQMNKLKGKLNEMDYDLSDLILLTTVSTLDTQDAPTTTVCKTKASLQDE